MQDVADILAQRMSRALCDMLGSEGTDVDPLIRVSQDSRFGDYQSNCAMGLAKRLSRKPRDVAQDLVNSIHIDDLCSPPEIAGPGFINFRLSNAFLSQALQGIGPAPDCADDRMGIPIVGNPETVVIDMSSPNLAKEMHVGHLRPTVIGDAVARILEFEGHVVHRHNHVGDWGTQFGMLIQYLRETQPSVLEDPDGLRLGDLEEFYVEAKRRFDGDAAFADKSRQAVVDLQSGDPTTHTIWQAFCKESLRHCHGIYQLLDIHLEDRGESFYNKFLQDVVTELENNGIAVESDGAMCVFPPGFSGRDGQPLPLIIQKSDGGYMYPTTDLAAMRYRIKTLNATRIVYVVGNQQKQHFAMLFKTLELTSWAGADVRVVHLPTGMLLNDQGAPFKTRDGGTVKLRSLLDEAVARARRFLEGNEAIPEKRRGYDSSQIEEMAAVIGLASVKYFELSHNLTTDYKFEWDQMLALDGNTAPYMLYAYARIQSIAEKAGVSYQALGDVEVVISHPAEAALAKKIMQLPETIKALSKDLRPNILTEYLYELSKSFSTFYDLKAGVSVVNAETPQLRQSRLKLCDLTARVLKLGLGLLGIKTLTRM